MPQNAKKAAFLIGRLLPGRYSLRSEASITKPRFKAFSSEVDTGSREENASKHNSSREFAQHILQNAAIAVVFEFVERIDAAEQRNPLQRAVAGHDFRGQLLARLQVAL
jgi:hypothetical protein